MLKESILQYFRPSLSYHLSLRPLFCLFLSGSLRQVLLYGKRKRLQPKIEHITVHLLQIFKNAQDYLYHRSKHYISHGRIQTIPSGKKGVLTLFLACFLSLTYFTEGHTDLPLKAIGSCGWSVPEFLKKSIGTVTCGFHPVPSSVFIHDFSRSDCS